MLVPEGPANENASCLKATVLEIALYLPNRRERRCAHFQPHEPYAPAVSDEERHSPVDSPDTVCIQVSQGAFSPQVSLQQLRVLRQHSTQGLLCRLAQSNILVATRFGFAGLAAAGGLAAEFGVPPLGRR
jgi:hypothetical protein